MTIQMIFLLIIGIIMILISVVIVYAAGEKLVHSRFGVSRTGPEINKALNIDLLAMCNHGVAMMVDATKPKLVVFIGSTNITKSDNAKLVNDLKLIASCSADLMSVVIVTNKNENNMYDKLSGGNISVLICDKHFGHVLNQYNIRVVPFAIVVAHDGTVKAKAVVNNLVHVISLSQVISSAELSKALEMLMWSESLQLDS